MPRALLVWIALALCPTGRAAQTEPVERTDDPRCTLGGPMIAGLVRPEGLAVWEAHLGRVEIGERIDPQMDPRRCPPPRGTRPGDLWPDLDTRFMAPAHSRLVTTLLAGVLATQGELDLDQPIAEALDVDVDPSLAEARVIDLVGGGFEVRTPARLLAADRSICFFGVDRLRRPGALRDAPVAARRRVARDVAQRPPPGPEWRRGELSFRYPTHPDALGPVLLAAIIEQRTRQSWEALVEARVLDPLGLGPLRHGPDPEGPAGLVWRSALLHPCRNKGRLAEVRRDPGALRPAGGLQLSGRELGVIALELVHPSLPIDPAIRARLLFGDEAHPGLLAQTQRFDRVIWGDHSRMDGYWDRLQWLGVSTDTSDDDAVVFGLGSGVLEDISDQALEGLLTEATGQAPSIRRRLIRR